MSEQEQNSQLSALFDGELPSQQADLVIRRASRDAAMRKRWQHYALIGACLRGEPLAGADGPACLAERVSARIASEAEILAPWGTSPVARAVAGRAGGRFPGRGAMGGAIAAAVAVMAVFVVRQAGPVTEVPGGELLARESAAEVDAGAQLVATAAEDSAPRAYTTPGENARVSNQLNDAQPLAHYVVAHSEQAASSLGFSYDLIEGTVLMTDDEIEAHLR
jgi:negative regulator of sigma E activity